MIAGDLVKIDRPNAELDPCVGHILKVLGKSARTCAADWHDKMANATPHGTITLECTQCKVEFNDKCALRFTKIQPTAAYKSGSGKCSCPLEIRTLAIIHKPECNDRS